jgi:HEXXH motif-containing protein
VTVMSDRLPPAVFEQLAGEGADAPAMVVLEASQRSRHALLIRELVILAANYPPAADAAGLGLAASTLDAVQRTHPAAVAQVLGYPLVGAWAAYCVRRMRSPSPLDEAPLWVDLAFLNAVAGVAAIRAAQQVDLPVPVRSGRVGLPGLGQLVLPSDGRWSVARLSGSDGAYVVAGSCCELPVPSLHDGGASTDRGNDWLALRRAKLTSRGVTLDVIIDDLDPYRDCHRLASTDRLEKDRATRWLADVADAWRLLAARHPHRVVELSAAPLVVVPLAAIKGGPSVNATARDSFRAIAMSPPTTPVELAQSLVHELQHSKLGALLDLVDLYEGSASRRFYSPWRADPRPVGGLVQAAYAFLAVALPRASSIHAGHAQGLRLSDRRRTTIHRAPGYRGEARAGGRCP